VAGFPERINEGSTSASEESDVPDEKSFESRHAAGSFAANDHECLGWNIRLGTENLILSGVPV
jgi:hypothetical protein